MPNDMCCMVLYPFHEVDPVISYQLECFPLTPKLRISQASSPCEDVTQTLQVKAERSEPGEGDTL